jgi:hypothetical protein
MCAWALIPRRAETAARSTMRENPGAVSGAPRSETNTNGDMMLSRWWRRSARNSRPVRGWVLGVPFLRRRTCRLAVLKSTCSHRRSQTSPARKPCLSQEHHQRVAVTISIALGRLDQPLDLVEGQVLTGSKGAIPWPAWTDCSIFSGWHDQAQAWFGHEKSPSRLPHCSIDKHFMNRCGEVEPSINE